MPHTFYVGIKGVIVNHKQQALVLKATDQNGKNYWDLPGGRIEKDGNINTTLTRELSEEILNIKDFYIKEILSAYRLSRDLKDDHGLMLIFYKVETELDTVKLSNEHSEYRWVGKDDLDSLNSGQTYIEKGYKEALIKALL